MKKIALSWGLTLVAAIVAVHFWQQLQGERRLTSELRQQVTHLKSPASWRSIQPSPAPTLTGNEAAVAATAVPFAAFGAATIQISPADLAAASAGTSLDPFNEVKRGRSLKLVELQGRYPGLAKELGLTPAEAEAFYDLSTKQKAALNIALQATRSDAEVLDLQQKTLDILEAQLGPARSRQWKEYLTTLEARREVNDLTWMLATSAPITEDQNRPLVASLLAEQKRWTQEESMRGPAPNGALPHLDFEEASLKGRIERDRRLIDAVRSFMTPDQVAYLQDKLAQTTDMTRASQQARRRRIEGREQQP